MNHLTEHEKINSIIWGTRHVFTTGEAYNQPLPNISLGSTRDRSPPENIRSRISNDIRQVDFDSLIHNDCYIKKQILKAWYLTKVEWSDYEKYALCQKYGGPCCVLAPLQAFILSLLKDVENENSDGAHRELEGGRRQDSGRNENDGNDNIIHGDEGGGNDGNEDDGGNEDDDHVRNCDDRDEDGDNSNENETAPSNLPENPAMNTTSESQESNSHGLRPESRNLTNQVIFFKALAKIFKKILTSNNCSMDGMAVRLCLNILDGQYTTTTLKTIEKIESHNINTPERNLLDEWYDSLTKRDGLLLLVYSFVATKGPENVESELGAFTELPQLIETDNGHGEQALLNLIITGSATSHVFDGVKDISDGLLLEGISQRSDVGILTIHEAFKLLEVGENLKTPVYPIWVIASESHYTVLWTNFQISSKTESSRSKYKKIIKQHEQQDGCQFIDKDILSTVLAKCDLYVDREYCEFIAKELDADGMGIIFINTFLDYFGEEDEDEGEDRAKTRFECYHYNGRPESNLNNHVKFSKGLAQIIDWQNTGGCDSQIEQVLQTKWKNVQVEWEGATPSIT